MEGMTDVLFFGVGIAVTILVATFRRIFSGQEKSVANDRASAKFEGGVTATLESIKGRLGSIEQKIDNLPCKKNGGCCAKVAVA